MAVGESELNYEIEPVITEQEVPEDGLDKEADVCSVEDFNAFFRRFGREDDDTIQVNVEITTPEGEGGDADEAGEEPVDEPAAEETEIEEDGGVESWFGFEDDEEGGIADAGEDEGGSDETSGDEEPVEEAGEEPVEDEGGDDTELEDDAGEDDVSVGVNVNVTVDNEAADDGDAGEVSQEDFDLFFRKNFGREDDVDVTVSVDGEQVAEGGTDDVDTTDEGDTGELEDDDLGDDTSDDVGDDTDDTLDEGDTGELETEPTEEEAGEEDDDEPADNADDDAGEEDFDYNNIF
jgi:hypothetical protein